MNAYANNARQLTIWFTLVSTSVVFALTDLSRIHFDDGGFGRLACMVLMFFGLSIYCWRRDMFRLAPSLEAVALGGFLTLPILVSTYLAASLDMPLMDVPLARADAELGLRWIDFIRLVDAHPAFAQVLGDAYRSFGIQLLGLPVILAALRRQERCYAMILAYGVICYLSAIVSIWFPALGTYPSYGVTQGQLRSIDAYYGFAFLNDFNAVRQQAGFTLSAAKASGIVTFPSVHAAVAFLCAWAAWDLKPVRYIFVAWNVLMGVSAMTHANHYLVDVIAGVAIAGFSIYLVGEVLRRLERAEWSVLPPAEALARLVRGVRNKSAPRLPS